MLVCGTTIVTAPVFAGGDKRLISDGGDQIPGEGSIVRKSSQEAQSRKRRIKYGASIRFKERVTYSERCERWSISLCSGRQMFAAGRTLNAARVIYHLWQLGEREHKKNEIKRGKRGAGRLPESPGACWGSGVLASATLKPGAGMWFSLITTGMQRRKGWHERKK